MSSSMRRGGQWYRPSPATTNVAVIRLGTGFPASDYALVYNHRTLPSLRKATRMHAWCVRILSGAHCGKVAVDRSCSWPP